MLNSDAFFAMKGEAPEISGFRETQERETGREGQHSDSSVGLCRQCSGPKEAAAAAANTLTFNLCSITAAAPSRGHALALCARKRLIC